MKRFSTVGAAMLAALALAGCTNHACDVCDDCGDGMGCGPCGTAGASIYAKRANEQRAPGYVVPGTQALATQPGRTPR